MKFFEDRGIPSEILRQNKVGFRNGEIIFPFFKDDKIVNNKYRTSTKRFRQDKNALKIPYGLDDIKNHQEVYWVEGEMDKLAMATAGFNNCISVPDGAPAPGTKNFTAKFDFLNNCEKEIAGKKHIIAVDTDEPGQALKKELLKRLGIENCYIIDWFKKDANEMLMAYSVEGLSRYIAENRKEPPVEGIWSIDNVSKEFETLYNQGITPGGSTGWNSLDTHYTIKTGQLSIITGIPSHGKSAFIDALVANLALNHNWRTAIFSPENFPLERHMATFAMLKVGKPFSRNYNGAMTYDEMREAKKWIKEYLTYFYPPEDGLSVEGIIKLAKVMIFRRGIKGLVIDPWNEIDHQRPRDKSETEYISDCLTQLRRFARRYNIHIWLVAHPYKLQRIQSGDDAGNYPVPSLYDISGSAHWRNKADCGLCVWRDMITKTPQVQIHIQKIRFQETGKPGAVNLNFDKATGRYYE